MKRSQLTLILFACFLCGLLGGVLGAALTRGEALPAARAQEGEPVPPNLVGTFQIDSYATNYGRADGEGYEVKHGAYAVNTITGEVFHITPGKTSSGTSWKMDKVEPGKSATGH